MVRTYMARFAALILLALAPALLPAREIYTSDFMTGLYERPRRAPVADDAEVLSDSQISDLKLRLEQLEQDRGVRMYVLTTGTLGGSFANSKIDTFGRRQAEKWGLVEPDGTNGVLLVVAVNDRLMHIEVADALAGALSRRQRERILDDILAPAFRSGDYAGGITKAVRRVGELTKGLDIRSTDAGGGASASAADQKDDGFNPLIAAGLGGVLLLGAVAIIVKKVKGTGA